MSNRGKNPNSLKALTEHRNRRGQRNRAAVAFTRTLRELIVKEGEHSLTVQGEKHKKVEWMVRQLWAKAIAGEAWAVAYISDRVEGKITQPIGVEHSGGVTVFTNDIITGLVARRSSGDSSTPGANENP